MKKLTLIIAMVMMTSLSGAQTFEKYVDMRGVSSMVMTSDMFKLLADIDFDSQDPEVKRYINLIENLKDIKVLSTEDNAIATKLKGDVDTFLSKSTLKELMSFRNEGKNVKFYSKPGSKPGSVSQLLMFLQGEEKGKPMTVLMSITGDIDLKEVSKLAEDLKVPGAEELKKIDANQ